MPRPSKKTATATVGADVFEKDPSALNVEERRFLQARGKLPEGLKPEPVVFRRPDGSEFTNAPVTMDNLDAMIEARARELIAGGFTGTSDETTEIDTSVDVALPKTHDDRVSEWMMSSKQEMEDEIHRRNQGRDADEHLSLAGRKDELANTLATDDEANEDDEEE